VVGPGDDPIDATGERCEVREPIQEQEGDESWWSWSTYFPEVYTLNPQNTWNIFTQWHADTAGVGGPPVAFELGGSAGDAPYWQLLLRVRGGQVSAPTEREFTLGRIEPGAWNDFLFHVSWSSDPERGSVEVWLNGQQVLPPQRLATLFEGSGVYVKQGFYRGESEVTTAVVEDGLRLGTSRAAVEQTSPRPKLPELRVSSSLRDGETVRGAVRWRVRVAGAPARSVEFAVDGRVRWLERHAPYCFGGDRCLWNVGGVEPGTHDLRVRVTAADGRVATLDTRVNVLRPSS
jgi:hypothetical protein